MNRNIIRTSWVAVFVAALAGSMACGSTAEDDGGSGLGGEAGTGANAGSGGAAAGSGGAGDAGGSGGSQSGGSGGLSVDAGDGEPPDSGGETSIPDGADDGPQPDADASAQSADCARLADLDTALAAAVDEAAKVVSIEQFMLEVEQSAGFPIRCAPDATFFFRKPAGFGPPSVAGDFNGWDSSASPMTQLAGEIYWTTLPIDTGPNRYLYKFTDGTAWVPDPIARRFGYDTYGEYSLVSGGVGQGHLERHVGIAGYGLPARPLTVYLPPGYETSPASFPVLYAHDGQNLFDPEAMWGGWRLDVTIEQLLDQAVVQPFIVVGIHNTAARMDEYTHVPDMLSGQTVGGDGDAYFDLVRTRIMPLVESQYRVRTGPENTWTMGSSLGGLISLYFGMKHPDVFGRVAGMSSTLGWGSIGMHNPTLMDLLGTVNHPNVVFYLDSGGGDGGPPGCVDTDNDGVLDDAPSSSDNYCETLQMRDALASDGYVYDVNLYHWHEPGAPHNEAAWAARVERPLEVLAAP